jgi:hypothetical protein
MQNNSLTSELQALFYPFPACDSLLVRDGSRENTCGVRFTMDENEKEKSSDYR